MAKKPASPQIKRLTIPDRASLEDFLKEAQKEAKAVWRSTHPTPKKKRGPPSLEKMVWGACDAILLEHGDSNKPLTKKNTPYPFTSAADWVEAIKQRLNLTSVEDPERTKKSIFERGCSAWMRGWPNSLRAFCFIFLKLISIFIT